MATVLNVSDVLTLGDLAGPFGDDIGAQVIFGSVLSGIFGYLLVRFLTRNVANRILLPVDLSFIAASLVPSTAD